MQSSTQVSHDSQGEQKNNQSLEAPIQDSGSVSASSNDGRKVSRQDIELVSWTLAHLHLPSLIVYICVCACLFMWSSSCVGPKFDREMSSAVHEQRWGRQDPLDPCKNWPWIHNFSMAETGRRERWFFQSLLHQTETEEADHCVQSLAWAPVSPHEVSCSS